MHDILKNKSLAQRDYLWTTYINGLAHREERLFQIITYFDEGKVLNGLSEISTKLFWLCMGEKQFFLGGNNQIWKRWEGCAYYDQGQISGKLEPEGVN